MAQESVLPAAYSLWHTACGMLPVAYCQWHVAGAVVPRNLCNLTKMRGPATFSPLRGYSGQRELNADGMAPALTSGGTDDGNGF